MKICASIAPPSQSPKTLPASFRRNKPMNFNLENIFKLESEEKYNEAYYQYKSLLKTSPLNFDIWKYYYFFLWSMIEDVNGVFTIFKGEDLRNELKNELDYGLKNFEKIAEFNFLAGYTTSIFPYEYGDYEEMENFGKQLLSKASELESNNVLFKMVFLGSLENPNAEQKNEYNNLKSKVRIEILEKHYGNGLLNEYFNQVFIRK
ncbi:hypothetical protein HX075_07470 [Empedobacter sp. 189-2]|nr:hypothetical protein [Empedobacter sp. 189-2]